MPKVKLKVTRWLCRSVNVEPTDSGEMWVSIPDGESILGMVRRLAGEKGALWRAIFDEKTQEIGPNVLVVLNGCIVNASDRSEGLLKDGDELMFLPTFDGG
jgi:molybdopterin converting factor small subunit